MDIFPLEFEDSEHLSESLEKLNRCQKSGEMLYFDVEELEELVTHFLRLDQLTQARAALKVGRHIHPQSEDLKIKWVEYYLHSKRYDQCLRLLDELGSVVDNDSDLLMLRAEVLSKKDLHEAAIACMRRAMELVQADERVDIVMEIAQEYQGAGEFDKAIDILERVLWDNPDRRPLAYELQYCYALAEMDDRSISFFRAFTDENPYSFQGWYNLGMSLYRIDNLEEAIQCFDFCTLIDPEASLGFFQKAFMLMEMERYADALQTFDQCSAYEDQRCMAFHHMGECYEKLDDWDRALEYYQKAIDDDEGMAESWIGIALIRDLQGQTVLAIPYVEKAIEFEPYNPEYYLILANMLSKTEQHAKSLEVYRTLLKDFPHFEEGMIGYARELNDHVDSETAISELMAFRNEHPLAYRVEYVLGALMMKSGMQKEGLNYVTRALEKAPDGWEELLSSYPEAKNHPLLNELILLHKR